MPVTRRSQSAEPEPQPQPRRPRSRANSREPPPSNRNLLKPSKGLARKTASKRDEATPVVLNMEEGDQQRGGANGGGPVLAPVVEEAESTPMRPKTAATPTETQSSSQEQGTQLEASDIDPLLALDNLPDLNQSADKILKLLGTDIEKQQNDLLQPESMLSRRLNNFRNAFIQQKRTLGNAEYIHAKAVQQVLDTARFTPILHKVNMAVLAIFLNTCQLGTRHAWQEFQNIERDYPTQVGMVIDTSEKFKLVLDMRTHTTLAGIATMSSDPELSHREIIQAFFFEQESNRGRTRLRPWENITYKNWGKETRARIKILIDAFNDDTDPFEAIQEMRERFPWVEFASRTANYIRTTYKEPIFQNKVKAAVRAAEIMVENGTPPPEDLQETTIEDITEGSNANTSAGSARPDVGDATDGDFPNLPEDVYENERVKTPEAAVKATSKIVQAVSGPSNTAKEVTQFQSPAALRAVKEIVAKERIRVWKPDLNESYIQEQSFNYAKALGNKSAAQEQPPPSSPPQRQAEIIAPISHQIENGNVGMDEEQPQTSGEEFKRWSQLAAEKNKENQAVPTKKKRFLDPQENATKVSPFQSQLEHNGPTMARKGKRRAATIERDSDSDEEFRPDDRPDNHPGRKKRRINSRENIPQVPRVHEPVNLPRFSTATTIQGRESGFTADESPKHNSRAGKPRNALVPYQHSQHSLPSPPAEGNAPAPIDSESSEDEDVNVPPASSFAEQLRTLNAAAKIKQPYRPRRGKKEWTHEEENKLVQLIGTYGPAWKLIENMHEPLLEGRTNVMIKDKALAMKVIMLRNQVPLPHRFESFNIRQKDRDMLRDRWQIEIDDAIEDEVELPAGSNMEESE